MNTNTTKVYKIKELKSIYQSFPLNMAFNLLLNESDVLEDFISLGKEFQIKAHAMILKMGGGHIREAARFTITLGANKISNFKGK